MTEALQGDESVILGGVFGDPELAQGAQEVANEFNAGRDAALRDAGSFHGEMKYHHGLRGNITEELKAEDLLTDYRGEIDKEERGY